MRERKYHLFMKMPEGKVQKRIISDNKIERNERINGKTVKNSIAKYKAELTDALKHNVLLVGDSKVCHLENEMTDNTHLLKT